MDERNAPSVKREPISCWKVLCPPHQHYLQFNRQSAYIDAIAKRATRIREAEYPQKARHSLESADVGAVEA
jgi:hypothetical protein